MTHRIDFNFSHVFTGTVWNTIVSPGKNILLLEVRDSARKEVSFSALDCVTGKFLWRDVVFDEPWWVSLGAAIGDVVLFTIYLETNNPDKKGVFAYHMRDRKIVWWNNDFSLTAVSDDSVIGVSSKFGTRTLTLDPGTGNEISSSANSSVKKDEVIRPQQYLEDNAYFATVKTFLGRKFNLWPVTALEYLELGSIIFISFYIQEDELANYLFILSDEGEVLMKEKLDEHLKGIGLDTFFVLAGCVFFVKDKAELHSYKIV